MDTKYLTPKDYQMKEIVLGKPTVDTTKVLITASLKKVFSHLDKGELEILVLWKQNELLRGYLNEIVGPTDPDHPEIALGVALERKEIEQPLGESFFDAYKRWHGSFEDKEVQIIEGNLNLLHGMHNNVDKLVTIVNQDFGLMDEVRTWANDLQALKSIKGKRYQMLMEVYTAEELDKLDDWIEKLLAGNKFMEGLYEDIQKIRNKA